VVDPVMVAKGGAKLLQDEAIEAMKQSLIPLAKVITPNIPEAEVLAGIDIRSMGDRREAALRIQRLGAQVVVIKGGHDESERLSDLVYDGESFVELESIRYATRNTHGTGCTFSAAITAELAKGYDVMRAIEKAKAYIQAAIEDELFIGGGHGPTNHWAYRRRQGEAKR
jgi:hydroxymethylpyrimidine/phosphomethylpyrimidine kinase